MGQLWGSRLHRAQACDRALTRECTCQQRPPATPEGTRWDPTSSLRLAVLLLLLHPSEPSCHIRRPFTCSVHPHDRFRKQADLTRSSCVDVTHSVVPHALIFFLVTHYGHGHFSLMGRAFDRPATWNGSLPLVCLNHQGGLMKIKAVVRHMIGFIQHPLPGLYPRREGCKVSSPSAAPER